MSITEAKDALRDKVFGDESSEKTRYPGGWYPNYLREGRLNDLLLEVKEVDNFGHAMLATINGAACDCKLSTCEKGCPLDKHVPRIMDALQEVHFELFETEFLEFQRQLDALLKTKYKDITPEAFFGARRAEYLDDVNRLRLASPRELQEGLERLRIAYNWQVGLGDKDKFARNPFPEFTGYLCPAPCEAGGGEGSGCTKKLRDGEAVRIRMVEYHLAELGTALGWLDDTFSFPASWKPNDKSIAIVGAGPAGLQLAYTMRMQGYDVTLIDKDREIGGLMYRGIPDHKFPKWRLAKYHHLLENLLNNTPGEAKIGTPGDSKIRLGVSANAEELKSEGFDAVVVATGVMGNQTEPRERAAKEGKAGEPDTPPEWLGFKRAKELGLTQDAYGALCGLNVLAEAAREDTGWADVPPAIMNLLEGDQAVLVYGEGDTAADLVQWLARIRTEFNPNLTAVQAFRFPGLGSNVAGGGYGIAEPKGNYRKFEKARDEDKKEAGIATFPGAVVESITPAGNTTAEVKFVFYRPEDDAVELAKEPQRGQYEIDTKAGGIYVGEGVNRELKGVRLYNAETHDWEDHAYSGQGVRFSPLASPTPITGNVDGTLELPFTCIYPALGASASKNQLLDDLGLAAGVYDETNHDGSINGVFPEHPGSFVIGDAGWRVKKKENMGNEQLIVSAQASAIRMADDILGPYFAYKDTHEGAAPDTSRLLRLAYDNYGLGRPRTRADGQAVH